MKRLDWNAAQRDRLGLSYVLTGVRPLTPSGRERLRALAFFVPGEEEEREEEFRALWALLAYEQGQKDKLFVAEQALARLRDVRPVLERLEVDPLPDAVELFELKRLLETERRLLALPGLLQAAGIRLADHEVLFNLLEAKSGRETFYLEDEERLPELRRRFARSTEELRERKDTGGRECLRQELREQEKALRLDLGRALAQERLSLLQNLDQLGLLDFRLAKLRARPARTCRPVWAQEIGLLAAWHPVFAADLEEKERHFQPLDFSLQPGASVLSGANMGGKTVALRTLLLNTLLVNLGFLPYAQEAKLPLFDAYHLVTEEEAAGQSGLSSFGADMVGIREAFAAAARGRSLLVLDEPARGTNPRAGAAIVKGLLRYAASLDSLTLVATHFPLGQLNGVARWRTGGLDPEKLGPKAAGEAEQLAQLAAALDYRLYPLGEREDEAFRAIEIAAWLGLGEDLIGKMKEAFADGDIES